MSADSGGSAGTWEWWGDWAQTAASWFGGSDPLLNDKQRRILRRAGYQPKGRRAYISPTGEKIKGKKALKREIAKVKQLRAAGSVDYEPIDDPVVFAAAAGGMSAEQERIWKQRKMRADPKYREKELARLLRESEARAKKATVRGKIDPALKRARALLKTATRAVVRDPKLAAKLLRVAKVGGPSALLTAAFEGGYYVGSQIYEKGTSWYYGKPAEKPPKATGRLSNVKITAKRLPEPGSRGEPAKVSGNRPGTTGRPQRLPEAKLEQIKITAQRMPEKLEPIKVTAKRLPAVKPVPKWLSRIKWAQKQLPKLSELQRYQSLYESFRSQQRSRQLAVRSTPRAVPATQLQPQTAPLTALQPAAVRSGCKPCKCKTRKKSTKPRCRNPVISRRKRDRNGVTVQTITRELRC